MLYAQLLFLVKNSNDPYVAQYVLQNLDVPSFRSCYGRIVLTVHEQTAAHLVLLCWDPQHKNRPFEITPKEWEKAKQSPSNALSAYLIAIKPQVDKNRLQQGTIRAQQNFLIHQQKQQLQLTRMWADLMKLDDIILRGKVSDPNPLVRLIAIQLAAQKRLPVETELIRLLADEHLPIREASHQALIRLSRGTDFGPPPTATARQIAVARQSWTAWLAAQNDTGEEASIDFTKLDALRIPW